MENEYYSADGELTLSARGPSLDVRIWRLEMAPVLKENSSIDNGLINVYP